MDRILLDANAILNATFIPQSWSSCAIGLAIKNRMDLFVGDYSVREAVSAARKCARELRKHEDPIFKIEEFITRIRALQISPDSGVIVPVEIPKHDVHVYRESFAAKAAILTSDGDLWLGCKQGGIKAFLPLEVIRRFDGFSLATTVFGVPPSAISGSVFSRGYPVKWGGFVSSGKFTLVDFPGVFWIFYDASEKQWVAEIDGQSSLKISADIADGNSLQTVALSWNVGGNIVLRVAGVDAPAIASMHTPLHGFLSQPPRVAIYRNGEHSWSGAIYFSVSNDKPISKDSWRRFMLDRDLSPNPFDSDQLKVAINASLR